MSRLVTGRSSDHGIRLLSRVGVKRVTGEVTMKLLMTATNRPEAPKGLPQKGTDVWYNHETRTWERKTWGETPKLTMHPVDIGQGVC